jgi:predicted RNA binding protein YcfA (HicA-like mRNA interferase family)
MLLSKLKKLLQKIKNNPRQVRFEELDKILLHYGFSKRQPKGGSSHYYYSKDEKHISVPFKQHHIGEAYVELALEALKGVISDDEENA